MSLFVVVFSIKRLFLCDQRFTNGDKPGRMNFKAGVNPTKVVGKGVYIWKLAGFTEKPFFHK